ncbi:protein-glutamate methylesterase/protein-glutamine glutaminase [Desulfonema magnum]|uniref:Protein-glutamate methylesterase/protein-glutamine glutaminase n=1 Tax=Desulfonema magnum TaxID=45655 RepID=A0A975BSA2_9BACT|nr:chemotaxis response regulator protein-glutamate methylesterase [Desulfonema magnum]QTA90483.1 Protein-glutamate methylesterase/protein-glutamine glutaminase [Desulfonema magnum]
MRIKTKILIVDDSRIFRSAIEESLSGEDDIEVIGSVRNGIKAIEFIRSHRPDLVTLDIEMPDMDGLETLKEIRKINASDNNIPPIGVIMVSSVTNKGADITIKALEAGAFDFITKPEGKMLAESIEILHRRLVIKIRYFASRRISSYLAKGPVRLSSSPVYKQKSARSGTMSARPGAFVSSRIKAILIGVSTGGPRALAEILPPLCEKVSVPIFIVQHMPPTFTQSLANSLNLRCSYTVTEGLNNSVVQERHVYIAPGGRHMLLRRRRGNILIITNKQPPEKGCRPSADVLFRSAATVYGGDVIAIILTGMGADGTKGAGTLKRSGAYVIAQDEESSVVWGMPGSAEASGNVDKILPLENIPEAVSDIIHRLKGAGQ